MGSVDLSLVSIFFFSSRRRHTRCSRDWSSDVCSSDLAGNYSRQPGQKPAGPPDRNEECEGSHAATGGAQDIKAGADRAAERVGETGGPVRGALVIPSAKASGDSCGNAR